MIRTGEGQAAIIGPSISIRGDLTGEEDLVIEGRVEGEVQLKEHQVEVGKGGRVKADIHAKTIHILGQVDGAYSDACRPRIPIEADHLFRGNSISVPI